MKLHLAIAALALITPLAGCKDDVAKSEKPPAVTLTADAAGYYCQMLILEHQGPKAQIHLAGASEPLWFAQVRDGIAYLKSPEQSAEILAFYVTDMGTAASWQAPGPDNWIAAGDAYFVVGSDARGGMGAPEVVPFGDPQKAGAFAAQRGGTLVRLSDIPAETVLAPVEIGTTNMEHSQ